MRHNTIFKNDKMQLTKLCNLRGLNCEGKAGYILKLDICKVTFIEMGVQNIITA